MEQQLAQADIREKLPKKEKMPLYKKAVLIGIACVLIMGAGAASVLKASNNPEFCTICHNMQPYYDSWNDSDLLAHKHKEAGIDNCHECHESDLLTQAEEGFKYLTGDFEDPLTKRRFTQDFCLKCHTEFEAATGLNQDNPGQENPYDNHNRGLECYICHSMHR